MDNLDSKFHNPANFEKSESYQDHTSLLDSGNEGEVSDKTINKHVLFPEYNELERTTPKIAPIERLLLSDIASRHDIKITEMEDFLKIKIPELVNRAYEGRGYSGLDEQDLNLLDSIYNLYLESTSLTANDNTEWINAFKSFDSFKMHFFPRATRNEDGLVAGCIQQFIYSRIHPQKELSLANYDSSWALYDDLWHIYEGRGEWIAMPQMHSFSPPHLLERSVIEEVIDLVGENFKEDDFSHTSGSAALSGIAKYKALLSTNRLSQLNQFPKTGEYFSQGNSYAGGSSGHNEVYASPGSDSSYGYAVLTWFDQFPITFGINADRQSRYLESIGFDYGNGQHFRKGLPGAEGIHLGEAVPLDAIDTIYYWKKYEQVIKQWCTENAPHIKTVSYEAVREKENYESHFKKIAEKNQIQIEEVWKSLLG